MVEKLEFLLSWQDDEELLCFSLFIMSNLLPLCSSNFVIIRILERILNLLSFSKTTIQRSCFITVRNILLNNEALTQVKQNLIQ